MSIYNFPLYYQLPVEICNHIMKYMGKSPTAKLIEKKCNNYRHYEYKFGNYLQPIICKNGFYSYIKFKHNKFLTREQHYDLIFANWLYENPHERVVKFVEYYHEYSITSIVEAEEADLGENMVRFIAGNTMKFIICYIFCKYINSYTKKFLHTNYNFDFNDLLMMYEINSSFIERQFELFRKCRFEKICEMSFVGFLDEDYAYA